MQTLSLSVWPPRLVTFGLGLLAAAGATFWALKWTAPRSLAPASVVQNAVAPVDPVSVARLLGGGQQPVATPVASAASRDKLIGVVAEGDKGGKGGYALIAIDGQLAKPYRVGSRVSDEWVLQSVATRSASLSAGGGAVASLTLELAPPGAATSPKPP